jgi:hypothetical protein
MSIISCQVETIEESLKELESIEDQARIQEILNEVKTTLSQMMMELNHHVKQTERDLYNHKIKDFKARIHLSERKLLLARPNDKHHHHPPSSSSISIAMDQQEKKQEQAQKNSLAILNQLQKTLAETEQVATSTLTELTEQKNTIASSKQNMSEISSNLNHSNKLLNKMNQWFRS